MHIIKMEVGTLGANCYIVYCEETRDAAIIDPGGDAPDIIAAIHGEKLNVKYIIDTHGHADHVMANLKVKEVLHAPILIHSEDAEMLTSSYKNLSSFIGMSVSCGPADRLVKDGDEISIGNIAMTVLHTPGHTPGGISLLAGNVVFSGDTLFAESIGRTDFPGGSYKQLIDSIKNSLLVLPDDTRVLPGHGPETTIGWERRANPFIQ